MLKEIWTLSIEKPSEQHNDQKSNFSQLKLKQNGKEVLSLVSRNNQDGIPKLNTAPQLSEAIIIEGIPKKIPKIKLIKKSCLN